MADEHLQASRWRERRGGIVGFLGDCFVFARGDLSEGRARMEHLFRRRAALFGEGGFLANEIHRLMRSPSQRFHLNDVIARSDMRATVVALTDDGRPRTVEFRFTTPLESVGRRWMRGEGMGLIPWTPPPVGETVVVPAPL